MQVQADQRLSQVIRPLQTQIIGLRLRLRHRGRDCASCRRICSRSSYAACGHGVGLWRRRCTSMVNSSFRGRRSLRFQVHLLVRGRVWQRMKASLDQKMSRQVALIGARSFNRNQLQSFSGCPLGCLCRPSEEHATICWKGPWPRRSRSKLGCQTGSLSIRLHLIATYLPRNALFGQPLHWLSKLLTHDCLSRNACPHSYLRPHAYLQTHCEIAC